MTTVNFPPGMRSVKLYDGTRYVAAREGGHVTVDNPDHAAAINAMGGNGDAGLLSARWRQFGGSRGKPGRTCCGRLYYAFTTVCPRCGSETVPE